MIKKTNLYRGTQFYWSQKEPMVASKIYDEFCKKGDIIWDPFLGAGSSLYGIRGKSYSFVGTEINEYPYSIVKFNLKEVNEERILRIQNEFDCLILKIGNPYEITIKDKVTSEIEKVVFDKDEQNNPIVKEIKFTKDSVDENHKLAIQQYSKKWLENKKLIKTKNSDLKLVKNSRLAIKDEMWLSDIFSPINFVYLNAIKKLEISNDLKFVISSALHLCRLTDLKAQSQFPYWVPKNNVVDRNVIRTIQKKIDILYKMIDTNSINEVEEFSELSKVNKPNCFILNKPIQNINDNDIPNKKVDFVLTDPPYFDQVAYSEYSIIWEYFLDLRSNIKDEIVISQRMNTDKNEKYYLNKIEESFKIIHKKLKNKAKLALYFKDSRIDKTIKFLHILKNIGFELIEQRYISKNKYTYKQNNSAKTSLNGESMFILIKSNIKETKPKFISQSEYKNTILAFAKKIYDAEGSFSINQLLSSGLIVILLKYENSQALKSLRDLISIIEEEFDYESKLRVYKLKI